MSFVRRIISLALCLILLPGIFARAEIFIVPEGIRTLESEALSGIKMPDGILLGEELNYIAPDAFEDTTVYGVSGGKAEAYAKSRNLDFVPIEISDITIDVPAYASPYRPFSVSASAKSVLPCKTVFSLYKDGALYYESEPSEDGSASVTLYEGGLYDYKVTLYNDYSSAEAIFEGETEIYEPVMLSREVWYVAVGDSFRPIDEAEQRSVQLQSDTDALSVSGDSVTANRLGTYTLTAVTEVMGDYVYTDIDVNVVVPVKELLTGEADIILYPGDIFKPEIQVIPEDAENYIIEYESSNPQVATVSKDGTITALQRGEAVISISTFNAEEKINVSVRLSCDEIVILPPDSGTDLIVGSRYLMGYEVLPEEADDISVHWISSNEKVATVDAAGYVSALSAGSAVISVISDTNPSARAEIEISVRPSTQSISADIPETMYVGDSAPLNLKVLPEGVSNEISWVIDDPNVVSIGAGGEINALSSGQATITFTSPDWYTQKYTVNVYERCRGVSLRRGEISLNAGMSIDLSELIEFMPYGCLVKEVSYTSNDASVVSVSQDGTAAANKAGNALIFITADGISAALSVSVVDDGKVISSINVSPTYLVLTPGKTSTISANISSADGKYKSGEWYSDNEEIVEIASVSSSGVATIRALRAGSARVYCLTSSGLTASCEVLINPIALKAISVNTKSLTLDAGETASLDYTLSPTGADDSEIFMYSSNPAVADVSDDGIISAIGAGECDIFITDGEKAASCHVRVNGIQMTSAWLCESEYEGFAGETALICYEYEPKNATPATFTWTSDEQGVADVDAQNGIIMYISEGETVIRGEAADGSGLTLTLSVRVSELPVKALTLSTDEINLLAGESANIYYSVYPLNASYGAAVFESADESIAKVDESGKVTAVRSGQTEIFVSVGYGDNTITRTVTVNVSRATNTRYRAFIMGQFTVPGSRGYLPFSFNSTRGIYDALSQSTIDGGAYSIKYLPSSPTMESVRSAIASIAAEADEDDVTVIYLLTHGSYTEKAGYYMQFSNGSAYYADTIISDVTKISGHVVLVLCSCHSGRALQSAALAKIKANGGAYTGKNGAGRLSVICSSTDTRSTYYDVTNIKLAYDFYSKAFSRALGWDMIADSKVSVAADANRDGQITLKELQAYVKPQTQNLISAYIQQYGTANFFGDPNQYPSCYIAPGEENLVIFERH